MNDNKAIVYLIITFVILGLLTIGEPDIIDMIIKILSKIAGKL